MTSAPQWRLAVHLVRAVAAIMISIAALLGLMAFVRLVPMASRFLWFGPAIAIAAGYVPLWRWYPRDAYPIGLVFCPAMFFLLRHVYEWAVPWIWRN